MNVNFFEYNKYRIYIEERDEDFAIWQNDSQLVEGLSKKDAINLCEELLREQDQCTH